jgi:hypothetical protein
MVGTRVRRLVLLALGVIVALIPSVAVGDKPTKGTYIYQDAVYCSAGEDYCVTAMWSEICEFDVVIRYDERQDTKIIGDKWFWFYDARNVLTNMATGKQIIDKWSLVGKGEGALFTGDIDIKGQCEHATARGEGTVVLDAGRWIWNGDGSRIMIGGPKDLNDPNLGFPPYSYCALLR